MEGSQLKAAAPFSNSAISTTYATLFSTTGNLSDVQQINVEAWILMLNNSGVARTYSFRINAGTGSLVLTYSTTLGASATSKGVMKVQFIITKNAIVGWIKTSGALASATVGGSIGATGMGWTETSIDTSDGATISLDMKSSDSTITQTASLMAYKVTAVPNV